MAQLCRRERFAAVQGFAARGDDHFPEDWLASTVRARNAEHGQGPDEGLTRVQLSGNSGLLLELLRQEPGFWLGDGHSWNGNNLGALWKLLDSSVRLQIQAHPSAAFARAHLRWERREDGVLVYPGAPAAAGMFILAFRNLLRRPIGGG